MYANPFLRRSIATFLIAAAVSGYVLWRGTPYDAALHGAPTASHPSKVHPSSSPDARVRLAERGPLFRDLRALAAETNRDAAWEARLKSLFRRSLKTDPHGAAALLEPFAGQPSEIMAGLALAGVWAEIDAESAYTWLRSLPANDIRQSYYESAGTALGAIDPLGAIARADALAVGWNRREYLKAVVIGWQEKDFTAALTWADRLKPGDERNEVLIPLLSRWSQREPVDAMNYVSSSIPPGRFQDDAAFNVAANWLKADPQAVEKWIGTAPAGELRNKLVLMVRDYKDAAAASN